MAKKRKITLSDIGEATANREEFVGHNTVGSSSYSMGTGMLPSEYAEKYHADKPSYVVKHWATPIAWHGESGWSVPDVKYSSTTSRRQNAIRRSINSHFMDAHNNARE